MTLAVAIAAALVYVVLIDPSSGAAAGPGAALQPAWFVVDLLLLGGAAALAHRFRGALGFSALDASRLGKLAALTALAALAIAAVAASQLLIADRNGVWLDESQYLETVRRGEILRHGVAPFSMRWLVPFFAGRWNLLPVDGALALKAVNFAALALTCFYLMLLLIRLRVPLWLTALAPGFLLSSYLGTYAAGNRLVIDAFNYAMFVLLFHALVRPGHGRLFAALLLLASFNSEKAICWVPIYAMVALLRRPSQTRWTRAVLVEIFVETLRVSAAALIYLVAITLYAAPARTELATCGANLHLLSFTSLHVTVKGSCAQSTTFQMLWMPFGPFTLYALLAFAHAARTHATRWLAAFPLLLVPVFLQVLAATDTERMVAYAFIVYLPLGFLYLTRAFAALPPWLARTFAIAMVILAIAEQYLVPTIRNHHLHLPVNVLRMSMSALELALVGALLFLHHAVFAAPETSADDGSDAQLRS